MQPIHTSIIPICMLKDQIQSQTAHRMKYAANNTPPHSAMCQTRFITGLDQIHYFFPPISDPPFSVYIGPILTPISGCGHTALSSWPVLM